MENRDTENKEVTEAEILKKDEETILTESQDKPVEDTAGKAPSTDEIDLSELDEVLEKTIDEAIILQESNTVKWRVEGLFDDEGEILSARKLKKDPPILIVESVDKETGEENFASFVLTPEFSRTLQDLGSITWQAYNGIKAKELEARSLKTLPGDLLQWAKDNKGSAAFLLLFTLIFIIYVIAGIFN